MKEYKAHELSNIIPSMTNQEYRDLKSDIQDNGIKTVIVLFEDQILDGRHRYRACKELKIEPRFEEYKGNTPLSYVISFNIKRRHLTIDQKVVIGVESLPKLEEEAKKRMSLGGGDKKSGSQKIEYPIEGQGKSIEHAAKLIGVNRQYIHDANKIKEENPELYNDIKEGKIKINQARRAIKKEKRENERNEDRKVLKKIVNIKEALGKVKFPTITIDPPWDWGDEGDDDQLGRARPDYVTMSFEEILEFPVADFADKDCHIYLWITNRSLPKGFALLEKWGFRYITCITWCKPSFGMGNYFRGATEHILFGVKGQQELKRKNATTWFQAKRGKSGHSSKPEEFYQLVESCSPGPYLEIFARSQKEKRADWTQWGNNNE